MMTLRSVLAHITAHPGCTVNDVLTAHGLGLEDAADDEEYFDREETGGALLNALAERGAVTYVVTARDGWQYTATGK